MVVIKVLVLKGREEGKEQVLGLKVNLAIITRMVNSIKVKVFIRLIRANTVILLNFLLHNP